MCVCVQYVAALCCSVSVCASVFKCVVVCLWQCCKCPKKGFAMMKKLSTDHTSFPMYLTLFPIYLILFGPVHPTGIP